MSELSRFRVVFEAEASEFIIAQSKRRRRRLMDICYAIADSPYSERGFVLPDADSRPISHITTEGYLISYWGDDPVKRVVIAEIEQEE